MPRLSLLLTRGTRLTISIGLIVACIAQQHALAAGTRATSIVAIRSSAATALDITFSDAIWHGAPTVTEFTNATTRKAASLGTTARILYDAKNLYVGFTCAQAETSISDSQNVQDVVAGVDDYVAFDVDPSGAGERSYTFYATPNGLRYQTSSESSLYFPSWTARGQRTADGYAVLMIIPLNVLRAQSGHDQTWRINFQRHLGSANEDYTWAYDAQAVSFSDSTTWPAMTGLDLSNTTTRPPPHASAYALAAAGRDASEFQNAFGAFAPQSARHIGLDLSVPFTNTASFVATLNPDFSNIERDETTIIPQQYRRSLSEYRPFFAQGAQFITPLPSVTIVTAADTPFYTPSIGEFDRGLKIEGTQGPNGFGILDAKGSGFDDQALGYAYTRPDNSLSASFEDVSAHHTGIFDQTMGIGLTRRNASSGEGTYFSFLDDRGTLVTTPGRATSFTLAEGVSTQRLTVLIGYKAVGAEYQPIDGYTAANDISGPEGVFAYNGVGSATSWIKTYNLTVAGDAFRNGHGDTSLTDTLSSISVTSQNLLSLSATSQTSGQRFYDNPYPIYTTPRDYKFDQTSLAVGFRDGTPAPTDASYSFGPFAIGCGYQGAQATLCDGNVSGPFVPAYLQQVAFSTSRQVGRFYSLSLEYDGVRMRSLSDATSDGQWLRSVSLSRGIGLDSSVSLQLRSISGEGGFATPGVNLSGALHMRFRNLDELFLNFGSPASTGTLDRFLVKYVFNIGSGTGV